MGLGRLTSIVTIRGPRIACFQIFSRNCYEFREEALKSYQRLFKPNDHQAAIYFDFSRDTLRIGITRSEYYLTEGTSWFSTGRDPCMEDHSAIVDWPENHEINIVENLQFMITEDDDIPPCIWHQIRRFPALRELTVMPWENYDSMDWWMKLYRAWIRSIAQKYPEGRSRKSQSFQQVLGQSWGL